MRTKISAAMSLKYYLFSLKTKFLRSKNESMAMGKTRMAWDKYLST